MARIRAPRPADRRRLGRHLPARLAQPARRPDRGLRHRHGRAIAKAIFGDANAYELRVITAAQRIPSLQDGSRGHRGAGHDASPATAGRRSPSPPSTTGPARRSSSARDRGRDDARRPGRPARLRAARRPRAWTTSSRLAPKAIAVGIRQPHRLPGPLPGGAGRRDHRRRHRAGRARGAGPVRRRARRRPRSRPSRTGSGSTRRTSTSCASSTPCWQRMRERRRVDGDLRPLAGRRARAGPGSARRPSTAGRREHSSAASSRRSRSAPEAPRLRSPRAGSARRSNPSAARAYLDAARATGATPGAASWTQLDRAALGATDRSGADRRRRPRRWRCGRRSRTGTTCCVATWDWRPGRRRRARAAASLIWGRLDATLDRSLLAPDGASVAGLAVSLPEACRLSDALAGQLRARLALDPSGGEAAERIRQLRAQLERIRDQVGARARRPPGQQAAPARSRAGRPARSEIVDKAGRGGDVGGLLGPLEAEAATFERDLIVGGARRREATARVARARAAAARPGDARGRAPRRSSTAASPPSIPRPATPSPTSTPSARCRTRRRRCDAYLRRLEQVGTRDDPRPGRLRCGPSPGATSSRAGWTRTRAKARALGLADLGRAGPGARDGARGARPAADQARDRRRSSSTLYQAYLAGAVPSPDGRGDGRTARGGALTALHPARLHRDDRRRLLRRLRHPGGRRRAQRRECRRAPPRPRPRPRARSRAAAGRSSTATATSAARRPRPRWPAPARRPASASVPTRTAGAGAGTSSTLTRASSRLDSAALGSSRATASGSRQTRRVHSGSARLRSARLGPGSPGSRRLPTIDAAQALMANPEVPEDKRDLPQLRHAGRALPGRPARAGRRASAPGAATPLLVHAQAASPATWSAGQYEVAGCLAHGGLGWIYLARDTQRLRPLGGAQGPAELRRPRRARRRHRRAAVPGPGRAPADRRDLQLRHPRGRRLHRDGVRRRHLAEADPQGADARPTAGATTRCRSTRRSPTSWRSCRRSATCTISAWSTATSSPTT